MNPRVIVCPLQLVASDRAALAQALRLARSHGAELHVLHVRPGGRRTADGDSAASDDAFHARLTSFIQTAMPEGVTATPAVLAGDPLIAVAEYIGRTSADLIVVPQHGRPGSAYWPAGAFAIALGRAADCPTIVVPAAGARSADTAAPFCTIVCAIDFSEASIRGLRDALTLAHHNGGRITLLHVLEEFSSENIVNQELQLLVPPGVMNQCDVDSETVSGAARDAIRAVAEARKADLIVMGLPLEPRPSQLVSGSTVKRVLRRAPCPVLIVPGPAAMAAEVPVSAKRGDREVALSWR